MNPNPWWVPLLSVMLGAILTFVVMEYREWKQHRRERLGHFEALAAEIQICGELANGYIAGKVMAPAYRLPVIAYERSLPALLADGLLEYAETNALIRFYVNVQSLNFAMDKAQDVLMKKEEDRPPERLELEVRRARLKAKKLSKNSQSGSLYSNAMTVVRRHLPKSTQTRLAIESGGLIDGEEE